MRSGAPVDGSKSSFRGVRPDATIVNVALRQIGMSFGSCVIAVGQIPMMVGCAQWFHSAWGSIPRLAAAMLTAPKSKPLLSGRRYVIMRVSPYCLQRLPF
jgi:hypothetical protein